MRDAATEGPCATAAEYAVMLVDDHPVVAVGVKLVLRQFSCYRFVGAASTPETAVGMLAKERPDAVILDLTFNGHVQLSLVSKFRASLPDAVIVVFSSLPNRPYRQEALSAGADAFVSKETDIEGLIAIMSDLLATPRTRSAAEPSTEEEVHEPIDLELARGIHLTPRERDVARLLSRGAPIGLIAETMGVSVKTAAAHRDNLRRKFGCRESSELIVRLAHIYGETTDEEA